MAANRLLLNGSRMLVNTPYNPNTNFPSNEHAINWSHEKLITFNIEYLWKIDQFETKFNNLKNKGFDSPVFFHKDHDIKLNLYIQKITENNEKFLSLFLTCLSGEKTSIEIPITFNFFIVDKLNIIKNSLGLLIIILKKIKTNIFFRMFKNF